MTGNQTGASPVIEADTIDPSPVMQPADNGIALPQSDFSAANPELSIVRRYADAIEQGYNQPDPYKRTTDELVRHQNYIALHVHPTELEPNVFSASTLMSQSSANHGAMCGCYGAME